MEAAEKKIFAMNRKDLLLITADCNKMASLEKW